MSDKYPQRVQMWKTSDGKTFDDKKKATLNQVDLDRIANENFETRRKAWHEFLWEHLCIEDDMLVSDITAIETIKTLARSIASSYRFPYHMTKIDESKNID